VQRSFGKNRIEAGVREGEPVAAAQPAVGAVGKPVSCALRFASARISGLIAYCAVTGNRGAWVWLWGLEVAGVGFMILAFGFLAKNLVVRMVGGLFVGFGAFAAAVMMALVGGKFSSKGFCFGCNPDPGRDRPDRRRITDREKTAVAIRYTRCESVELRKAGFRSIRRSPAPESPTAGVPGRPMRLYRSGAPCPSGRIGMYHPSAEFIQPAKDGGGPPHARR
jgi:hypothetical protein